MAKDIDGILFKETYFQEAIDAKAVYESDFVPTLDDLKKVQKKLKNKKVFKGKSRDEVLGLLEILVQFYETIIEDMEGYYDTFADFKSELKSQIEAQETYTKVQDK